MSKLTCLVLLVACAAFAGAAAPSSNLRFAKARGPAAEESTTLAPGQPKPLSTAMKCVMSLLFLYFLVLVIMKVITFKKQFSLLFDKMQADTGMTIPSMPKIPGQDMIPGMGEDASKPLLEGDADKKEGEDDKKPEGEAAAAPAESAAEKSKRLAMEQAMRAKAMTAASVGWVKDMLSENKLQMVMTNMSLVPMFCILITFCRLRARVDLETEPQSFAKLAMVISTVCLYIQILIVLLPQCPETEGSTGMSGAKVWAYTSMLINITGTLGLYGGVAVICYGIFSLKYKEHLVTGAAAAASAATGATGAAGL